MQLSRAGELVVAVGLEDVAEVLGGDVPEQLEARPRDGERLVGGVAEVFGGHLSDECLEPSLSSESAARRV